ncbi:hypothetical protein L596_000726 [Steinernema carpocapsae]|uniref:Protein kinase domain-containing protein n=1 Tax=Steinernema carpocapsae TaxID=34508 RepID=A0A4U8UN64_STECR|nr:hypothetical protein L596_000726 [Steinernema carpocapsae]
MCSFSTNISKPERIVDVNGEAYQLKRFLGNGRHTEIHAAKSLKTGSLVALKQINKKYSDALKNFQQEIQFLGKLNHTNVIKLIYAQESNFTILTELAKYDLFHAIYERKKGLCRQVKNLIPPQLIDALAYIHSQGIAHMDIKAENVVFTNATTVKLIDFNLAKKIPINEMGNEMRIFNSNGTRITWSPQKYDRTYFFVSKDDIWALGFTLLEIEIGNPWAKPDMEDRNYQQWVHDPLANEDFRSLAMRNEEYFCLLRWMLNQHEDRRCSAAEAKESVYIKQWLQKKTK